MSVSMATVTSRGRVTIPLEVRRKLGLRPGTRIVFLDVGSGAFEIHVEPRSIRDLAGIIPPPARPVTLDEMDDAIAAGASDRFARRT